MPSIGRSALIRLAGAIALVLLVAAVMLLARAFRGGVEGRGTARTGEARPTDAAQPGAPGASPTPTTGVFSEDAAVLDVAIPEPASLDPMRIQDPGSFLIARQLYEGLTSWDAASRKAVPAAATGWRVLPGGRTFVFQLRAGMTFHDGTPVTAQDFVFAFDRIAQKRNASELAYTLENVKGFKEVNKDGSRSHLEGLRAPRPRRLVIELSEPFHDLPELLTHPALVPLSKASLGRPDQFLRAPVGNGPFRIAEPWTPGQPVLLQAFDAFRPKPELDGIRFAPFGSAATSWLQFVRGQLDVAQVPVGQFEAAAEHYGRSGFRPLLTGYYYGFNLRSKDVRSYWLRRAVSQAINRGRIAAEILEGTMQPPRGIVPTGMPGFDTNVCGSLCAYSPEAARSLLEKVPKRARRITLQYPRGAPHDQIAQAVAGDLGAVGIAVKLESFPLPRYLKLLRDGKQSVYRLGWIAEYPSADVFLSPLFRSTSAENYAGFKSKRVDRLLSQAHRRPKPEARHKLYLEAEKLILKSLPVVPIGSFVSHWAVQPEVQNLVFDATGGFDALRVSLEEE